MAASVLMNIPWSAAPIDPEIKKTLLSKATSLKGGPQDGDEWKRLLSQATKSMPKGPWKLLLTQTRKLVGATVTVTDEPIPEAVAVLLKDIKPTVSKISAVTAGKTHKKKHPKIIEDIMAIIARHKK